MFFRCLPEKTIPLSEAAARDCGKPLPVRARRVRNFLKPLALPARRLTLGERCQPLGEECRTAAVSEKCFGTERYRRFDISANLAWSSPGLEDEEMRRRKTIGFTGQWAGCIRGRSGEQNGSPGWSR